MASPKINRAPTPMTNPSESGSGDSSTLGAEEQLSAEDIASPEAIRQQLYVTGHLDVRI